MKKTTFFVASFAALLGAASSRAVTIQLVPVGNPGNAPDTRYDATGFGSVGNAYQIGMHEVTAGQYTEFLNAVAATADPNELYSIRMDDPSGSSLGANIQRSGSSPNISYSVPAVSADRPVNFVSFWDAVRFANWLHNDQPIGPQGPGTTEDGAYHDVGNATLFGRNAGAKFFIPTEDEWYKAAYHDGETGNYWDYPTVSNTAPINTLPDSGNHANFFDAYGTGNHSYTIGSPHYRTQVGAFANSASVYGTFDQGGNVWEWNETAFSSSSRGLRGASFFDNSDSLRASYRYSLVLTSEENYVGFRVASIPEPDANGDYNQDGVVDAADYVMWRKNDGSQAGYNNWRAHFGNTPGTGSAIESSVPEPGLCSLLFVAAIGPMALRRPRLRAERAQVLHGCRQLVS